MKSLSTKLVLSALGVAVARHAGFCREASSRLVSGSAELGRRRDRAQHRCRYLPERRDPRRQRLFAEVRRGRQRDPLGSFWRLN